MKQQHTLKNTIQLVGIQRKGERLLFRFRDSMLWDNVICENNFVIVEVVGVVFSGTSY
jgi:hypothetical protein